MACPADEPTIGTASSSRKRQKVPDLMKKIVEELETEKDDEELCPLWPLAWMMTSSFPCELLVTFRLFPLVPILIFSSFLFFLSLHFVFHFPLLPSNKVKKKTFLFSFLSLGSHLVSFVTCLPLSFVIIPLLSLLHTRTAHPLHLLFMYACSLIVLPLHWGQCLS